MHGMLAKAINEFQDPKLRIYNCLWLYQKGAIVAEELGYSEFAFAFWNKFISLSEHLLIQGSHVRQVHLDSCRIRPPREEEVQEAKRRLNEYEKKYLDLRTNIDQRPQTEVEQEIHRYKNKLIKQGGSGCLLLIGIPMALILVVMIVARFI